MWIGHDSFISNGRVIYSFESLITLKQPCHTKEGAKNTHDLKTKFCLFECEMDENELKETKSDRNKDENSASIPRRPFKWFVLVTYAIFSSSLAMSEVIFAPIPKQTAAYYGIKGKYF